MNKSIKNYDQELLEIDHFSKFPCMLPFVGENYEKDKKIMMIAESHYLPPYSTISRESDKWYESTEKDLNKEELAWVNTRQILSGDLKPRGHMIYKEIDSRMSEIIDTKDSRALDEIVLMNGFQRPAPEAGESIKYFTTEKDFEIGARTIEKVIKIVKPDIVLFISKYSWDNLKYKLSVANNIKFDFVCHPGTGGRYWHNTSYEHGISKFREIIKNIYQN